MTSCLHISRKHNKKLWVAFIIRVLRKNAFYKLLSNNKMRFKISAILIALFFTTLTVNASKSLSLDPPVLVKLIEKDFPLFRDSDEKIIYIDFELLLTNVKSLRIVRADGKITFQDDVSNKEVNGIYEIDYSSFEEGAYRLELFAYSGDILNSEFVIK